MIYSALSPRAVRLITGSVCCLLILIFVRVKEHDNYSSGALGISSWLRNPLPCNLSLTARLRESYQPILHHINDPFSVTDDVEYETGNPVWTKPLGHDLCIVDIDTRDMSGPNEAWSKDSSFDWAQIKGPSPGIFNHYLYAQIHGYCYKFIHTTPFTDRTASWTRLPALASLLESHKILVAIDADVVFPHLQLPFEWLLNHWNITSDIAIAMAVEPSMEWWNGSKDTKGRQNLNDGFMIIQNIPQIFDMLKKWERCPEDGIYQGCEGLKMNWPAEQGAFSEYIRYEFEENIREIPCTEGLGWPEMDSGCKGNLVRHYTMAKDMVRKAVEESLSQGILEVLHHEMVVQKHYFYLERYI